MWKWSRMSGAQRNTLVDASLPLTRGFLLAQSADGCSCQDLPRTRFRGSLMLTVWSWEAERELFMERSAVEWQRGCCVKSSSRGAFPVPTLRESGTCGAQKSLNLENRWED